MFETLIQKLQEDKFLTLETTPQHEPSMHNIIERIKKFKLQDRVDGFSCTDNPLAKLKYVESLGVEIVERIPAIIKANKYNELYLSTKKEKMGHLI